MSIEHLTDAEATAMRIFVRREQVKMTDELLERMADDVLEMLNARARREILTDELAKTLADKALARINQSGFIEDLVTTLARDIAEDAAKGYIARVLGWRLTIEVGDALDTEPAVLAEPRDEPGT